MKVKAETGTMEPQAKGPMEPSELELEQGMPLSWSLQRECSPADLWILNF